MTGSIPSIANRSARAGVAIGLAAAGPVACPVGDGAADQPRRGRSRRADRLGEPAPDAGRARRGNVSQPAGVGPGRHGGRGAGQVSDLLAEAKSLVAANANTAGLERGREVGQPASNRLDPLDRGPALRDHHIRRAETARRQRDAVGVRQVVRDPKRRRRQPRHDRRRRARPTRWPTSRAATPSTRSAATPPPPAR